MSTFLKTEAASHPIRSLGDLRSFFQRFAKKEGEERIGIECELFGVYSDSGRALPYFGDFGIEKTLKIMAHEFGYEEIWEGAHVIALKKGGTLVTLEPGGQVELSAEPVSTMHDVQLQLNDFFFQLRETAKEIGNISWISTGIHPFSTLDEIEWVPKKRYQIMADYLKQKGFRAHDMMKRTAGNQVNLDYLSEDDAIAKMRLVLSITPIISGIMANSGFSKGSPTGFQTERLNIWRHTDPERCGLILDLICERCRFKDYLEYVLDLPVMFLVRNGSWVLTHNLTFGQFVDRGYEGLTATEEDFDLHLSTVFTDARFKHYLEIRGTDAQRKQLIPALYAFWKGILYDEEARHAAKSLLTFREIQFSILHHQVETQGMQAKLGNRPIFEVATELVQISRGGLKRQSKFNERSQDESIYLTPLEEEILKPQKTPADQLTALWEEDFGRDCKKLIKYLSI